MFSFKAFSDPKLQTSSLFAYQTARNVMWANVLTRLKVAVSWHINILCVCTMAQREFGWSIHVKNHNALIIVFLEMPLPIFRIVQEKTRLMDSKYTTHHPNWGHRRSLSRDCIPLGHWGMWTKLRATANLRYRIIWPFWSSKQWRSKRWSA